MMVDDLLYEMGGPQLVVVERNHGQESRVQRLCGWVFENNFLECHMRKLSV